MTEERDATVTGATAITSPDFLGHGGAWWDLWLVIALVVTALAAAAVGVTAAGSIIAHKREAAASSAALVQFLATSNADLRQLEAQTAGKIAEARQDGIRAGEAVAATQADLHRAQLEIAHQTAIAAGLAKDTAEAQLETARLQQQLAWRALSASQMTAFVHILSASHFSLSLLAASDPEAIELGHQLLKGLKEAGLRVTSAKRLMDPPIENEDAILSGSHEEIDIMQRALEAAGLTVLLHPSASPLKLTILSKPRV